MQHLKTRYLKKKTTSEKAN